METTEQSTKSELINQTKKCYSRQGCSIFRFQKQFFIYEEMEVSAKTWTPRYQGHQVF